MNAKEFDFGCAQTDGIFDKILEQNFVSISREATPKDNFGLNLIKSVREKNQRKSVNLRSNQKS